MSVTSDFSAAITSSVVTATRCVCCGRIPRDNDGEGVVLAADLWRCESCQELARSEPLPPDPAVKQTVEALRQVEGRKGSGNRNMQAVALRHRLEDQERIEARVQEKIEQFRAEAMREIAEERAAEIEQVVGDVEGDA